MLNSFRAFSDNLVTKLLLVLLIASFALWGVGDMLGGAATGHALATVGNYSISVDSYRKELGIESERVRRQLGANYSEELLKRLNVPQFVLRRMVQEALLKQEAERMGFIPDDTTVALEIRKTPVFINHSGVFDKARFESALRNQGVSEKTYVEQVRTQIATDTLLDALAVDLPITDKLLAVLQAGYNQGRAITLYKLSPGGFAPSGTASDAELQAFQKAHAEQFTSPEFRTVSFVRFSAADAKAAPKTLSEEAVREYYNSHEDQFHTQEKREVEQLLYDSEEKAREAYGQVKLGRKFAEIAASLPPLNRHSLSLGAVDKKNLPEAAAETVFSLKAGGFTEPVQSPFGWHIFRVGTIEPEGTQPLEKVRATVEAALKASLEENALTDRMNQMEDALAGGSTLAEAAKSMGLAVEQAGTFDREGNTPQGAPNKAIPALDKFVEVAFKTEEKTESSLTSSRGGVYYVLRVDSVTPERLRPFAEAKADIAQAMKKFQGEKAAADMASKVEEELAKGKKPAEILAARKLSASASGSVGRTGKTLEGHYLPPSLVSKIFASDVGSLTAPVRDKDGNYLFAYVTGIAPPESAGPKLSKKELLEQMQEEMMVQYLRHLETLYPVDIKQEVLDQLTQDGGDVTR